MHVRARPTACFSLPDVQARDDFAFSTDLPDGFPEELAGRPTREPSCVPPSGWLTPALATHGFPLCLWPRPGGAAPSRHVLSRVPLPLPLPFPSAACAFKTESSRNLASLRAFSTFTSDFVLKVPQSHGLGSPAPSRSSERRLVDLYSANLDQELRAPCERPVTSFRQLPSCDVFFGEPAHVFTPFLAWIVI